MIGEKRYNAHRELARRQKAWQREEDVRDIKFLGGVLGISLMTIVTSATSLLCNHPEIYEPIKSYATNLF